MLGPNLGQRGRQRVKSRRFPGKSLKSANPRPHPSYGGGAKKRFFFAPAAPKALSLLGEEGYCVFGACSALLQPCYYTQVIHFNNIARNRPRGNSPSQVCRNPRTTLPMRWSFSNDCGQLIRFESLVAGRNSQSKLDPARSPHTIAWLRNSEK